MNSDDAKPITTLGRIKGFFYSLIFDLPFDNYHKYYKTGKIQLMTKEEKTKIFLDSNEQSKQKDFFIQIIRMRPQILDDDDLSHVETEKKKIKYIRNFLILGLFFNWSFFSYFFLVKKQNFIKTLVFINLLLLSGMYGTNAYMNKMYGELYTKYIAIIKEDELKEIYNKIYNID